jgi:hypothetical protein
LNKLSAQETAASVGTTNDDFARTKEHKLENEPTAGVAIKGHGISVNSVVGGIAVQPKMNTGKRIQCRPSSLEEEMTAVTRVILLDRVVRVLYREDIPGDQSDSIGDFPAPTTKAHSVTATC